MDLCLHWTFPAWCNACFRNYSHDVARCSSRWMVIMIYVYLPSHWVFCIFRRGEAVPIMMPLGSKPSLFHRCNSKSIARWRKLKSVKQEHSKASKHGSCLISKFAWGEGGDCKTREILQWIWLDRLAMLHVLFLLWFCKLALICMTERCWKQMTEVKFSELSFSTQPPTPPSSF